MSQAIQNYNEDGLLRIGKMFPLLPTQCPDSDLEETLEEMRSLDDKKLKAITGWAWDEEMCAAEVMDNLSYQRDGFILAHVSTPIFEEDNSVFSWGYTTYSWVIGENMNEVIEKGLKWVGEQKPRKAKKK